MFSFPGLHSLACHFLLSAVLRRRGVLGQAALLLLDVADLGLGWALF